MRFHAIGLVKAGANGWDFASIRKEALSMTPDMQKLLLALLGNVQEGATALADQVRAATPDPNAPELAPELATALAQLYESFGTGLSSILTPAAPADEAMMSQEQVDAELAQVEQQARTIDQAAQVVDKARKTFGKGKKVRKAATDGTIDAAIAAARAAVGAMHTELTTAKTAFTAKAAPKLAIKQWMGLYTQGFAKFFALLQELLPFLEAVEDMADEGAEGPPSAPEPGVGAPGGGFVTEAQMTKAVDGKVSARDQAMQAILKSVIASEVLKARTEVRAEMSGEIEKALGPFKTRLEDAEKKLAEIEKAGTDRPGTSDIEDDLPAARPGKRKYAPGADISAEIRARKEAEEKAAKK